MDRIKETSNVVVDINKYRNNEIKDYELIKTICTYFNDIKNEKITQADLRFLKYISNIIGIPHFYDLLANFENEISLEEVDLNTFSSLFYESTLHTSETNKVHKYQKTVLELFETNKLNRYFLSASTSFGKTHVVFEIIKKMKYNNVVLIFPTIALLSENLERLIANDNYAYFREQYSIHTLSEVSEFAQKNIFIYTPERFLSFIEKNENTINFDFGFVDEVYKIDNEYEIDQEIKENERDIAYRLAVFYTLKNDTDILLAGPYIDFSKQGAVGYNPSFNSFLLQNKIELLDFNNYEIVNKSYLNIVNKSTKFKDERLSLEFNSVVKDKMLVEIIKRIISINENTIIYCPLRRQVESYPKKLIKSDILSNHDSSAYEDFLNHITKNFHKDWTLIHALRSGVGMHHGLIPKYIQKEIVSLFNKGLLRVLISTTTITEGVNTSAKNLIVIDSKKGDKPLKKFDAKNIAGRAGRFLHHYSGRVIILQNNFMDVINSTSEGIRHKNFDINSTKSEIDLYYTSDEYLTAEDKQKKINIRQEQLLRNIPDFIFEQYKVVSRIDKIKLYDELKLLRPTELGTIKTLISRINFNMSIDFDGFQVILKTIRPIIKNTDLEFLIDYKPVDGRYSTLTYLVHFYLAAGFKGSMQYNLKTKKVDAAIRDSAKFIYNTLKYQLVKYLGVFNIMYKFHISSETPKPYDDVTGIDKLLIKLEYNAVSEEARVASDYGVPSNIVDYYEDPNYSAGIKAKFDKYELEIFKRIDNIINPKSS
ncbi:MAG: helicase-related protein [Bacteroidota bacterium]|nr:helicase-related protein [Bacteroidota bacterium]